MRERTLLDRIGSILSYEDSIVDVYLNYTALAITLLHLILVLSFLTRYTKSNIHYYFGVLFSFGLFAFQISLCIFLECVGISIIWSAMYGFCAYTELRIGVLIRCDRPLSKGVLERVLFVLASLYCSLLWIYYLLVEPYITTLAHVAALSLGIILGHIFYYVVKPEGDRAENSALNIYTPLT